MPENWTTFFRHRLKVLAAILSLPGIILVGLFSSSLFVPDSPISFEDFIKEIGQKGSL